MIYSNFDMFSAMTELKKTFVDYIARSLISFGNETHLAYYFALLWMSMKHFFIWIHFFFSIHHYNSNNVKQQKSIY